jgi:hypothetical protein
MEILDLLYLVAIYILTVFVAVSTIVFVFLQQQWSLAGHGDTQQLKEKTVILPPFEPPGRQPGLLLLRENFGRRPSSLKAAIRSSSGGNAGEDSGPGDGRGG